MNLTHYVLCGRKPIKRKGENGFFAVKNYDKPVTQRCAKLYVVKQNKKVLYVGIALQSIANRLRNGFKAKGIGGYYGYKWKDLKGNLDLLVWSFPGEKLESIEAVEAEVVFAIRQHTGMWPSFQTEIHFHAPTKKERFLAKKISEHLVSKK